MKVKELKLLLDSFDPEHEIRALFDGKQCIITTVESDTRKEKVRELQKSGQAAKAFMFNPERDENSCGL